MNYTDLSEKIFEKAGLQLKKIHEYTNSKIRSNILTMKRLNLKPWRLHFIRCSFEMKGLISEIRAICSKAKNQVEINEDGIKYTPEGKEEESFYIWRNGKQIGVYEDPIVKYRRGIPGWHNECSYFISKYVRSGEFIHYGGQDLKSIHHKNEQILINLMNRILQKKRELQIPNYIHCGTLEVRSNEGLKKMSKSHSNCLVNVEKMTASKVFVKNLISFYEKINFRKKRVTDAQEIESMYLEQKEVKPVKKILRLYLSRQKCKKLKDYKNADILRLKLNKYNYEVEDKKGSCKIYRIKNVRP
jgi:cysteinyl-tRNA synthetase